MWATLCHLLIPFVNWNDSKSARNIIDRASNGTRDLTKAGVALRTDSWGLSKWAYVSPSCISALWMYQRGPPLSSHKQRNNVARSTHTRHVVWLHNHNWYEWSCWIRGHILVKLNFVVPSSVVVTSIFVLYYHC